MKKTLGPILLIIIAIAYYYYETQHNLNQSNAILESEHQQTQLKYNDGIKPMSRKDYLPSSSNQVIHHTSYSLSYNERHEQAEWTVHILNNSDLTNNKYKRPYFEIDNKVNTGAAHWRNYKNSGYDRGHLVPAADRTRNRKDYEETFLTSNISPQLHEFNAGIWNRLEQKTRYYAQRYNQLYVITGSVLNNYIDEIGTENVSVPRYFYKILYRKDANNQPIAIAFLLPHEPSDQSIYKYQTTIDTIEMQTGIDFFKQLPDKIERELESNKNRSDW